MTDSVSPGVLSPLARFLRYWLIFVAAVLAPIVLGVPWLDDAVAQVNLGAVALIAIQYAAITRPLRRGSIAVVRGGVTALAFAVATLFLVAAAYVLRHAAALPDPQGWGQSVAGMAYVAAAHIGSIVLVARRWPTQPPPAAVVRA